jgi:hypothetical protein
MYIANKGITQTKVYDNNRQLTEKDLKWNAKYDGKIADLDVEMNNDGEKKNLYMKFNNEDLAEILNVPSVGEDLYKRIKNDYKTPNPFQYKKNNVLQPDIHEYHNKLMKKYSPSTRSYYKKYSRKYTIRKQNNLKKNKKSSKPKTMRFF